MRDFLIACDKLPLIALRALATCGKFLARILSRTHRTLTGSQPRRFKGIEFESLISEILSSPAPRVTLANLYNNGVLSESAYETARRAIDEDGLHLNIAPEHEADNEP